MCPYVNVPIGCTIEIGHMVIGTLLYYHFHEEKNIIYLLGKYMSLSQCGGDYEALRGETGTGGSILY